MIAGSPATAATPADVVLEWNAVMGTAVLSAGSNPIVTTRVAAIVNAAIFDAVNGVEQRYNAIEITAPPSLHVSVRAAAIQAAYEALRNLYPAQEAMLLTRRSASLAALDDSARDIAAGIAWGHTVADAVWRSRSTDGFNPQPVPAFRGADVLGVWRPTPPANANGFGVEVASMRPWALRLPSQFRPGPPHALTSVEYAADYNETKVWGAKDGSPRSADQSELVLFWNGNGTLIWNRLAGRLAVENNYDMLQTARLLARLHLAMADAAIACWDSKYRFVYWRPITAIRLGENDGNAGTVGDPAWNPWLAATPAHPEYLSGHSTLSGAAAYVLENAFGADTSFWVDSDLRPGTRSFTNFDDALAEVVNARVFGGIHFRTACVRGNAVGKQVAQYVLANAVQSRRGNSERQ
ncbi:MAG TPA: vanadium-dependent haloperoxidase [Vicinamibacterales bacterium]|nr:vanadium-dependent haloperoxidase [Vicinamibacterales bacterium]